MAKIKVEEQEITVLSVNEQDYISLTDMAGAKTGDSRAADIVKIGLEQDTPLNF